MLLLGDCEVEGLLEILNEVEELGDCEAEGDLEMEELALELGLCEADGEREIDEEGESDIEAEGEPVRISKITLNVCVLSADQVPTLFCQI